MKKLLCLIAICNFLIALPLFANGVGIINPKTGIYLTCLSSEVQARVENQVAIVKTTQVFKNNQNQDTNFTYAFPVPITASATELRWFIDNKWYTAVITSSPDTGSGLNQKIHPNLKKYLGESPLAFAIAQQLKKDSSVTVELTYVELLPYEFATVNFHYPNDYKLIQSTAFDRQYLHFFLSSARTIESINLLSHVATNHENNGNNAMVEFAQEMSPANKNYHVQYVLDADELGLFSFSTFLPDSVVPDSLTNGFFLSVVEPDPSNNSQVIDKVFTLIIDRSGSMSGDKIVQAKNAAKFIVENLNEKDLFNLIEFDDDIISFRPSHIPYNNENKEAALSFIAALTAGGSTNISGAFGEALPQFATTSDSTANIIIFFTDGEATAGLTNTEEILKHVKILNDKNKNPAMIFTFGIGGSVNEQLLSRIAQEHNGLAEFLKNDELESKITKFYLKIRNPVLLNTSVSFSPSIITEVYPNPLPNLYKGQQMIIVGRYQQPADIEATFSGHAFGKPVSYQYNHQLTDQQIERYQFIPKIWAKQKIGYLYNHYLTLDTGSVTAKEIKSEITKLSVQFGIVSPFTGFTNPGPNPTPIIEEQNDKNKLQQNIAGQILAIKNCTIKFKITNASQNLAFIKIYNIRGQLVRILKIALNGKGIYEIKWDGLLENGRSAPADIYFCILDLGTMKFKGKMVLVK